MFVLFHGDVLGHVIMDQVCNGSNLGLLECTSYYGSVWNVMECAFGHVDLELTWVMHCLEWVIGFCGHVVILNVLMVYVCYFMYGIHVNMVVIEIGSCM